MLILVDSVSSHSFVSSAFLQNVGLSATPVVAKKVKLANGDILISDKMISGLKWWSNGHTLVTDMHVLDMPTYDAILGYDWLSSNSPMQCDWANKTIEFEAKGQLIQLKGTCPHHNPVQEVSMDTLHKVA